MDDRPYSALKEEHYYATQGEPSPFDVMLPEQPIQLDVKTDKFPLQTISGVKYVLSLSIPNNYHDVLFQAFIRGMQSDWFVNTLGERTKLTYQEYIRLFICWLNETGYQTTGHNRYESLKAFEAHEMNERGIKNSTLGILKRILNHGIDSPFLSPDDRSFLETLLNLTKPAGKPKANTITLSDWFSLSWLRPILGDKNYLQLESPRRLFLSFRITIATTLLFLLEIRQQRLRIPFEYFKTSNQNWQYKWNRLLIPCIGSFDENGEPADDLTQALFRDLVKPSMYDFMKANISHSGICKLQEKYTIKGSGKRPWLKPVLFHPTYQNQYSPIEEMLLAWLSACEAIQPKDISKLKTTDYSSETTSSGRLIMMECSYYKGRAGGIRKTSILMARDIWTRALHLYIKGLPNSTQLFKTKIGACYSMPGLGQHSNNNNMVSFLFKLWKIPSLQAEPLFLNAMQALENGSECYDNYYKRTGRSRSSYRKSNLRNLPTDLFSLTHIKNMAVHAGSDNYRDSDLINHHSHTSETEKHAYLTDDNKDFVNKLGRITRVVLHDLQNIIYQPSIEIMQHRVNDLEARTRLVDATEMKDAALLSLHQQEEEQSDSHNEIIVADTLDSAIYFFHYIDQSKLMLPQLLAHRPDFVERTMLIQVEWMSKTLCRMKQATEAKSQYATLREHLPPLFDHLIESIE
jgi:hypothetical protein